jgi:hypothetical protein
VGANVTVILSYWITTVFFNTSYEIFRTEESINKNNSTLKVELSQVRPELTLTDYTLIGTNSEFAFFVSYKDSKTLVLNKKNILFYQDDAPKKENAFDRYRDEWVGSLKNKIH